MNTVLNYGLNLTAVDITGQRSYVVTNFRPDLTVTDLINKLLDKMKLPRADTAGRPYAYHAYLDREGRHVLGSDVVGETLQEGDVIRLQPDIQAG